MRFALRLLVGFGVAACLVAASQAKTAVVGTDCAHPPTRQAAMVCSSDSLAMLYQELNAKYHEAAAKTGDLTALEEWRKKFQTVVKGCEDEVCLEAAFTVSMAHLDALVASSAPRAAPVQATRRVAVADGVAPSRTNSDDRGAGLPEPPAGQNSNWIGGLIMFGLFCVGVGKAIRGTMRLISGSGSPTRRRSSSRSRDRSEEVGSRPATGKAHIYRVGRSYLNGWEFDGKFLYKTGKGYLSGYEFDGRYLFEVGESHRTGLEWDGEHVWRCGKNRHHGYRWDGSQLIPGNNDQTKIWKFRGDRTFAEVGKSERYYVEGDVPIPVLAKAVGAL